MDLLMEARFPWMKPENEQVPAALEGPMTE